MTARLASVLIGGSADPWLACGFATDDGGRVVLGNGALVFRPDLDPGCHGLAVEGLDGWSGAVDGVQVEAGTVAEPVEQPNGAFELDHVVVMTDSLERTSAAIEADLGLECRRIRETETVRQGFHRFADGVTRGCIVEVVENPRVGAPALWGLVVNVADLDAAVAQLGPDRVGDAKPAVQPGRRIATVRSGAGLGVAVALMTPG